MTDAVGAKQGLQLAGADGALLTDRVDAITTVVRQSEPVSRHDIADAEWDEVRALLKQLGPWEDTIVEVVWPFDREGVRLQWSQLVERIDDLWAPSRDDLIVRTDGGLLIHLDHEETVAVHRA